MGKIKSKMMRRTVDELEKKGIEFAPDFEENKKTLGDTMPSKKLRNRIAGLAARLARQKKENAPNMGETA